MSESFSAENSALLLIDHQVGNNSVGLFIGEWITSLRKILDLTIKV